MKTITHIIFFIFISSQIANAEIPSVINYLMREPVSMLDFGIKKLNDKLDSEIVIKYLTIDEQYPQLDAFYSVEENKITIEVLYIDSSLLDPDNIKPIKEDEALLLAKKAIEQIPLLITNVYWKDGKPMPVSGEWMFGQYFAHAGYQPITLKGHEPLGLELLKLTEIKVIVRRGGFNPPTICKCNALSQEEEIFCSQPKATK